LIFKDLFGKAAFLLPFLRFFHFFPAFFLLKAQKSTGRTAVSKKYPNDKFNGPETRVAFRTPGLSVCPQITQINTDSRGVATTPLLEDYTDDLRFAQKSVSFFG
jgi:hypothetical protein